ncbi:glycosyltransferase [bacterium]|nr:glycosyltransferase [bacterium]
MDNKEKVSVVIPSFNRYKYLKNALESIFNQTYENIEIIVVNDGSTQKEYYEESFSNISFIHLEQNQKEIHGFGPGSIRNFGIAKASGDYIAFLDDDDYWLPNKIHQQIENLKKTKNDMVCSDALIGEGFYTPDKKYKNFLSDHYYSKMKKIYSPSIYSYYLKNFQIPDSIDYEFIRRINPIITSTVMIKTSLIKKVGSFRNLPLAADLDCWRGVLQFTNCSFIDEPLIYYDNAHGDGRNYLK